MPLINADGSQTVRAFRDAFGAETGLRVRVLSGGSIADDAELLSRCVMKSDDKPRFYRNRNSCNRFYVISIHDTAANITASFASECFLSIELLDSTGAPIEGNRRIREAMPADSPHYAEHRDELRMLDGMLRERLSRSALIFEQRHQALADRSAVPYSFQGYSLGLTCELLLNGTTAGEYNPLVRSLILAAISGTAAHPATRKEIDDELNEIVNGGEAILPRRLPYVWLIDDLMTVYGFSAYDLMRVGEFRMRMNEELWGI